MKKKYINIIPVFFITIAIILLSCEKIEESSPLTINTTNTAKLSGMAFVDLVLDKIYIQDQFNLNPNYSSMNLSDSLEYVPEGTEIHFRVLKTAYNPKAPTGEMLRFVTTVNANGAYSIDIPTTTEGVNVNISFDEFTASKLTWKYDSTSIDIFGNWLKDWYSSSNEVKTYLKTPATNTLHTGENKFLDFTYN